MCHRHLNKGTFERFGGTEKRIPDGRSMVQEGIKGKKHGNYMGKSH